MQLIELETRQENSYHEYTLYVPESRGKHEIDEHRNGIYKNNLRQISTVKNQTIYICYITRTSVSATMYPHPAQQ
jgi:hypothetical protein